MTVSEAQPTLSLPDHRQLPESDGTFVKNFQEHPQSLLLTSSIQPILATLHPDGQYAIGQDCGIYWRLTDPPEKGAEAPDWFYVPNVPPLLNGERRRSYVMWKEIVVPFLAIEFVSGDGSEEKDATSPLKPNESNGASADKVKAGKFWVYEQAIRIPFYAIYDVETASVEVYELIAGRYQRCSPNEREHYSIPPLGVELGIWKGTYMGQPLPWLRWWDRTGNLLLAGNERADQEQQRADHEQQRADQEQQRADHEQQRADHEQQRADRLAAKLKELGFDPDRV